MDFSVVPFIFQNLFGLMLVDVCNLEIIQKILTVKKKFTKLFYYF